MNETTKEIKEKEEKETWQEFLLGNGVNVKILAQFMEEFEIEFIEEPIKFYAGSKNHKESVLMDKSRFVALSVHPMGNKPFVNYFSLESIYRICTVLKKAGMSLGSMKMGLIEGNVPCEFFLNDKTFRFFLAPLQVDDVESGVSEGDNNDPFDDDDDEDWDDDDDDEDWDDDDDDDDW